jgi:hypothetical protein
MLYATQALEVAKGSLDLGGEAGRGQQGARRSRARWRRSTSCRRRPKPHRAVRRSRRPEATLRTSELSLKRMIVNGTEDPLWRSTLEPVDRPTFRPEPLDVEAAVRNALQNRTDLDAARKTVESNDITLKLLHNQTLPALDLVANYQAQGLGGTQFLRREAAWQHDHRHDSVRLQPSVEHAASVATIRSGSAAERQLSDWRSRPTRLRARPRAA